MRQTTAVHPNRRDTLLKYYDRRATIYQRSDAPAASSRIGSAYTSAGTRPETTLHSDVPARFEAMVGGTGERPIGTATVGMTPFMIGLLGMYPDISEQHDIVIDAVRFNIKAVGVQRLSQRTRLRVARKP